jgi:hypothetical protein
VYGTLGLINIKTDVFLCVITEALPVAAVRPGENVQRITSVEFYCINKGNFDYGTHDEPFDSIDGLSELSEAIHGPEYNALEHPCHALNRMLRDGTFYYSVDFDLTNRLQHRYGMVLV